MAKTVQELAQFIQGKVVGDGSVLVEGITNTEHLEAGAITFIQDSKQLSKIEQSSVAGIIVPPNILQSSKPLIQVPYPKLAWAKLLSEFFPPRLYKPEISPLASIAKSAKLGQSVRIEAFAVIGENVEIGDHSIIRSHSYIDDRVKMGADCVIHPHVMIYDRTEIGSGVVIHSGTVVGADGFGYVHTEKKQEKVPQTGKVIIEDDVELGAGVTIDRATLGATVIGKGCKIDNLVQIGHNVSLGEHTVISAQSGISGSSRVGAHVTMGGKVGLGDHVEVGDWTMVGAGAGIPSGKKVPAKQVIFGEPARPYAEARRQIAAQLRSAEMLDDIRKLKHQIAELQEKLRLFISSQQSG